MREGDHSQRISEVVEIWKGRLQDEVVALRVLKVSRQDPDTPTLQSVSVLCNPLGRWVVRRCPDG